jgi:aclacinomycin oxidase
MMVADRILPGDPRYADLIRRGFNKRFTGSPDHVCLVTSTEQAVDAVQAAVRDGQRLVARSGGHCLEGFVADPEVRVIVDTSLMTGVSYDDERAAFVVLAGTSVGEVYRRLFLRWGLALPAGEVPDIGVGGHVVGGAFGFLCRQHGLAADYLYAVEVVVVDHDGIARSVVATREPTDPHRDLWWAHTGGGGGNFGIVTRYWFRSLPKAPDSVLTFRASWNWGDLDERTFSRLVRNYGAWCERNSEAASPYAALFSILLLNRRERGTCELKGLSTAGDDAERLFEDHLAAINDGVGAPCTRERATTTWLTFALNPFPELFRAPGGDSARVKVKDALLRRRLTDRQTTIAYDYLTRSDHEVPGGMLGLATYGGAVNRVESDATASAQRDSIIDMACSVGWMDPRAEGPNLKWVRIFYRDLFADTGGVPVPGTGADGSMINHPDTDLANPEWNTSGVP